MTKKKTPWWQTILASIVTPPTPTPAPAKPKATIAFQVVDETSGATIGAAFATFEDGTTKQSNDDGYVAFERELGIYNVKFEADDYATVTKRFQLEANRQFTVKLTNTKPKPVVVPPPVVVVAVPPPPVVVTPPAPKLPVTDEEFHAAWLVILRKHGNPHTVNLQTLNDTKAEIEAMGCEWQHDSGGTLRPRLFLPVSGNDPFARPFDMGLYGEPWQWIKR